MNASPIQILGAFFLTFLTVPSLCGQSSRSDPWLDFPSYDQTLVWYLRRGADAKEGKRRIAQDSASVDTFRRLVAAEARDDALVELKRILEAAAVEGPHYDPAKALAAFNAITKEPFDSFVATAALAEAALKLTQGQSSEAEALMGKALDLWVTTQRDLTRQPPASSIDADVADIRQVVFRPLGDLPIYGRGGWNAFNFPAALPRFIVIRADVQVKTADGQVGRHTVYQRFPDLDHVLLLKSDELALLARLLPTIGGTKRREWTQVMKHRISQSAIRCKSFRCSGVS